MKILLKSLSALPLWFWYGLSDLLIFPVLYYLIGYRKAIVTGNLERSFPEKSKAEIAKIRKAFYHHFSDIMVEYIKLLGISTRELNKRISFEKPEVLKQLEAQGKSFLMVGGHFGNWELHSGIALFNKQHQSNINFKGIYKVQKNKAVDDLLFESRSRHGVNLLPTDEVKNQLSDKENGVFTMIFLGDQSPSNALRAHWTTFLNQDTGILMGTERYAQIFDLAVVYVRILQPKRGHFVFDFELISTDANATEKGEISEAHHQLLEKDIRETPHRWLWTHKRWKKKKP